MACARFDGYLDRVRAREGSRKHKPIIKGRHFPPVMGKYKIADANTLPVNCYHLIRDMDAYYNKLYSTKKE